eukprot:2517224-Pyramimonas_sp.AAC.1
MANLKPASLALIAIQTTRTPSSPRSSSMMCAARVSDAVKCHITYHQNQKSCCRQHVSSRTRYSGPRVPGSFSTSFYKLQVNIKVETHSDSPDQCEVQSNSIQRYRTPSQILLLHLTVEVVFSAMACLLSVRCYQRELVFRIGNAPIVSPALTTSGHSQQGAGVGCSRRRLHW